MRRGNDVGIQCRSAIYWTNLAAIPNGYCGLGGTGVSCPIGVKTTA